MIAPHRFDAKPTIRATEILLLHSKKLFLLTRPVHVICRQINHCCCKKEAKKPADYFPVVPTNLYNGPRQRVDRWIGPQANNKTLHSERCPNKLSIVNVTVCGDETFEKDHVTMHLAEERTDMVFCAYFTNERCA